MEQIKNSLFVHSPETTKHKSNEDILKAAPEKRLTSE